MNRALTGLLLLTTAIVFFFLGYFVTSALKSSNVDAGSDKCSDAELFMPFLQHFNSDMRFQKQRTLFPLIYVTYADHQPGVLDTFLIEKNQWNPLLIFDSAEYIVQVFRGASVVEVEGNSCEMSVVIEGINNDEKVIFYFIIENDEWFLSSFEDLSL